jgi:hypothetical protein
MREDGEYVAAKDWEPCFLMSWYSLRAAGTRFLERTSGKPADFLSASFASKLQAAIDAIKLE